ncbi:hypothetical protein SAMN04487989_10474 [Bizionia echini]|uniref:SpoIIAA-like n=1 Tax=Bizionia echini TaxID=649333 RepID=A0A1I5BYL0_9FLAO|nr:hypothetical protein [Bizionia echini]SFN79828.1 hypothetical protein SAMN04487989_10474 [Bizionia echini]|tara:strand:- start:273 stop:656 length:384 start_codon:yes stop_codon:yes gene_type:complete
MGMFHYYSLPRAELFVFDEFLVCQIREGMEIHPEHNIKLNEIIQKHFTGKNIVYVSNRINSYSVDPLTYVETEKIPNLVAIAMIPDTPIMKQNAEYERNFFDKPYEIFDTLSEAIQWVHKIIKQETK